jgi:hypothetical protein
MSTYRGVPAVGALDAVTHHLRIDHVCSVRRMDDVVRVAMEDDGANAGAFVAAAATRFSGRPVSLATPRMAANAEGRSAADW